MVTQMCVRYTSNDWCWHMNDERAMYWRLSIRFWHVAVSLAFLFFSLKRPAHISTYRDSEDRSLIVFALLLLPIASLYMQHLCFHSVHHHHYHQQRVKKPILNPCKGKSFKFKLTKTLWFFCWKCRIIRYLSSYCAEQLNFSVFFCIFKKSKQKQLRSIFFFNMKFINIVMQCNGATFH